MEDPSKEQTAGKIENTEQGYADTMDPSPSAGTEMPSNIECTDDLLSMWENSVGNENNSREKAFEQTIMFVNNQIEQLVSSGVEAFHRSESTARELKALREEFKNKDEELKRVRASEEKSRATVAVSC